MKIYLGLMLCSFANISFAQQWIEDGTTDRGRMRYVSGGELGFSVRTNSGGGWAWQLIDGGNNPYFHVEYPTKRVGIGTTAPASILHINSSIERETLRVYKDGNTSNYLNIWQGTGAGAIDPIGTGKLFLGYDQVTDVYMGMNGGKIGISTTNPSTRFSLGTQINPRIISLYDDVNDWYGFGIQSYQMRFQVGNSDARFSFLAGDNSELVTFEGSGNVGIGTTTPDAKLTVKGTIHTQEVKVDLNGSVAPDYVFEKDYPLTSLEELKAFIDHNKHLPEIPSAKEMEEEGVNLKEMNLLLLKKVEELTLYLIEQKEEIKELQEMVKKK